MIVRGGRTRSQSSTTRGSSQGFIATISARITLQPGDIIATGTPKGVGIGFDPPKFLRPGDVVEISITNLGVLRNVVGKGQR